MKTHSYKESVDVLIMGSNHLLDTTNGERDTNYPQLPTQADMDLTTIEKWRQTIRR
jgi:hypothetical protein